MMKLMTALMVTMFASAGLVGFTSTAADAGPYTGTVRTSTICKASNVVRGDSGRIEVRVVADGNATPEGRVTIRVVNSNGRFSYTDTKSYNGGVAIFTTPTLQKIGKYTVFCRFDRKPDSVWRDSNNTTSFRVMPRAPRNICNARNVERFDRGRVAVRIVGDGDRAPRGKVTVRVVKSNGQFRYINTKAYDGGVKVFRTPRLNKIGKYNVTCSFDSKPRSVWRNSSNQDSFFVTRRN